MRTEPNDVEKSIALALEWEPTIQAWSHLEIESVCAAFRSGAVIEGPLSGVPFAVKDVIDVAGFPTRFGSDAFEDAGPALGDAAVVAALRHAGGIPIGKTRTTEFAFIDPTITRNPYDSNRSPGGSSSGPGAVVGSGIVPFALGTQTAGSLCRPAAYCGAFAYKPSLGVLPTAGMSPLSPDFDAIGVIAQSAFWLRVVYDVLSDAFDIGKTGDAGIPEDRPLHIGLVQASEQQPAAGMKCRMESVVARLRQGGHRVEAHRAAVSFDRVIGDHRTIMLAEAAAALLPMMTGRVELLQPRLREALIEGKDISGARLAQARQRIRETRDSFWQHAGGYDLLLAYPVPDAAPAGLATTGDQSYLTPWTAFGGPLVSVPAGLDADGLPLGVLLCAAPGKDAFLVDAALIIASLMPPTPLPSRPSID